MLWLISDYSAQLKASHLIHQDFVDLLSLCYETLHDAVVIYSPIWNHNRQEARHGNIQHIYLLRTGLALL
jgi:hypothetical protein